MEQLFYAIAISLAVALGILALVPRHMLQNSSAYTRHMLGRLRRQNALAQGVQDQAALDESGQDPVDNPLVRLFMLIPGMQLTIPLIQSAGLWAKLDQFVLFFLLFFLGILFTGISIGIIALPLAVLGTWVAAWFYLRNRVDKRRLAFIQQFPDALDSMVRSVRSGHPLNTAISIIADNMPAPIGEEFRRVADETAHGWSLFDALSRMGDRLDDSDVRFFVVVLAVQQEAGGNLSEVLSNLSDVLRKRRHMRLKIKALSSEGRAAAWILGSLPVFITLILAWMTPDHLKPLYETSQGHMIVLAVIGMVATGMLITRQMINIDI